MPKTIRDRVGVWQPERTQRLFFLGVLVSIAFA